MLTSRTLADSTDLKLLYWMNSSDPILRYLNFPSFKASRLPIVTVRPSAETAVYKPAKAAETKVEESEATAKEVAEEDITS
ncbi:Atg11p [Colletotrichum filicis]|nr:Atg11p [Colletotrichum filicis]